MLDTELSHTEQKKKRCEPLNARQRHLQGLNVQPQNSKTREEQENTQGR